MVDVLCDCNCRHSAPNGVCMLECISIDNYGRCAEFEEPDIYEVKDDAET